MIWVCSSARLIAVSISSRLTGFGLDASSHASMNADSWPGAHRIAVDHLELEQLYRVLATSFLATTIVRPCRACGAVPPPYRGTEDLGEHLVEHRLELIKASAARAVASST